MEKYSLKRISPRVVARINPQIRTETVKTLNKTLSEAGENFDKVLSKNPRENPWQDAERDSLHSHQGWIFLRGKNVSSVKKQNWQDYNLYIYIYTSGSRLYPLGPRIGGVEQTQTSHKPELRTNPNFE